MAVGVIVTTALRSAPATDQIIESSTYFVVGQTQRGTVDKAVEINSLTDFEEQFGGYVTYGYTWDDVNTFFQEGGTKVVVSRVVGPSPSVSSLTLVDRAGTPVPTLRIDAYGPGAWGQGVTIDVDDGTESGTFKLTIAYSGTGNVGTEVYDNIYTPAEAVTRLNSSAYVRAVNLASATAAPNNQPALNSATALTSGSDDRSNVVTSNYTSALNRFGSEFGPGCVAIPGQPSSNVGSALALHAVANNRLALTTSIAGQTKAQAITAKTSLASSLSSGREYLGFFWPHIKVPDNAGSTRTIPPEGFVAAKRAQCHERYGPAQAPGATYGQAQYVADVETQLTSADINQLNDSSISPIALVRGNIQLYGWKSLSADKVNYELLSFRDVMNYTAYGADDRMASYVFGTIDGSRRLFSNMEAAMIGFLEILRAAGQLYELQDGDGNQVDPGYSVDTGPSVNTSTSIAANEARIAIAIRPSPSAQLIRVNISRVPLTAAV